LSTVSPVLLPQLFHQFPQPFGDGEAQCAEIFDDAQAFVGEIEKNHGGSQRFGGSAQQRLIEKMTHGHHHKDQQFPEDAFETLGTGELSLLACSEEPGQVVDDHKDGEAYQKAVPAAQNLTEDPAGDGKPDGQFTE